MAQHIQHIQNIRRAPTSDKMVAALALSGRRWALRVVWELRVGPLNFRALQVACGGVSPSVLQERLHELRSLEVIEMIPDLGYRLSRSGEHLFQVLAQLDRWSEDLPLAQVSDNK
jgi:DNA-binding HxlR family transcriptional regulator